MEKPARLWVTTAADARVLVRADGSRGVAAPGLLRVHASRMCQGAEPAGAWLLRAAVRVPLPRDAPRSGPARRRWIGALHVRWLHRMGVTGASLYEGPPVAHWASFGARLQGDVVVDGRKITSIAELLRPEEALLASSTLLGAPPWQLLCRVLGRGAADAAALEAASACAEEVLGTTVDAPAWGASLRAMLHLSLHLAELGADALAAD